MVATRFDVLGIGNAIVDMIARADDDFLVRQKMRKGTMQLIDEARATAIYDTMGPAVEVSGFIQSRLSRRNSSCQSTTSR